MTSKTNIVLFPIDAPELNGVCAMEECNGSDIPHDDYIKCAVGRVAERFAGHFGLETTQIRLISFDPEHQPATLIPLVELGHNYTGPVRLLDIDNFVCLLLNHECADWDQTCLGVSQELGMEFWAIGSSEQGDILRQEYARGNRLDGYFSDNRFGVNEGIFVDLVRAVGGIASPLEEINHADVECRLISVQ